ncbi:MAG: DUF2156 domain-containing protein [Polyangiaceae bacterium]|nr:DUF2156 domain-containing protein [Polyangiaceae bacterium]
MMPTALSEPPLALGARAPARVRVPDRERAFALVQRHGWNSTAFQTLEGGYSYFFHGEDACVAYVDTGGAWVAAGAPLAPPEALGDVVAAFVEAAQRAGKRCCFFATEERLHHAAPDRLRSVRIGEQPVWDPQGWPAVLKAHRSLREQLRRARAKGVTVRPVRPEELEGGQTHDAMAHLADAWLARRRMLPMSFLVRVEPFTYPEHRQVFVAERSGNIVAFAAAIPVPSRNGWFLEDLIVAADAPNGTSEVLVDAVMRWSAQIGGGWLTLGLAPLAGEVPTLLRIARRTATAFYDFAGLRAYKAKLRPGAWTPIHLAFPRTQSAAATVVDALAAFAGGRLMRFALRSIASRPMAVLRTIAAAVVLAPRGVRALFGALRERRRTEARDVHSKRVV